MSETQAAFQERFQKFAQLNTREGYAALNNIPYCIYLANIYWPALGPALLSAMGELMDKNFHESAYAPFFEAWRAICIMIRKETIQYGQLNTKRKAVRA
jgi:hypothetical protein